MKRRATRLVFFGGLAAAAAVPISSLSLVAPSAYAAQTYTVRPGDSLSGLQARLGRSAEQLAQYNHLTDPNLIVAGQVLAVPPATPAAYTVRAGDTLASIAAKTGTTVDELASSNHIADPNLIFVGEVIYTTGSQAPANASQASASTVTVAAPVVAAPVEMASYAPAGVWACIARYESGGNPAEDTGNGYYGMYQFSPSSWAAAGGTGMPQDASAAQQTAIAENLYAMQGWSAWPNTSRMCGA